MVMKEQCKQRDFDCTSQYVSPTVGSELLLKTFYNSLVSRVSDLENQGVFLSMKTKQQKKEYSKKYYYDNIERYNTNKKKYLEDNYEQQQKYWKDYHSKPENKERKEKKFGKEYRNQYHKFQRQNNPNYKILELTRHRINAAVAKGFKNSKSKDLLGCSITECREYIESKFLPEMNWSNHGDVWELDHIKPCINFDLTLESEQKRCFHYSNMQPLFKTTKIAESYGYENYIGNREKGDR